MLVRKVKGYDEFVCVADRCKDTCCAGWQIEIDEDSLERYAKETGDYAKELQGNIDWEEKVFCQKEHGRCAFLREDNLCQMYRSLGADSLCLTCEMFPRHVEEFLQVREYSLALSCPEVARQMLQQKELFAWTVSENEEREPDDEEFNLELYQELVVARETMISILQNRELPISVRAFSVLDLIYDMQYHLDEGELFSCREHFDELLGTAWIAEREKILQDKKQDVVFMQEEMHKMLRNLHELEPLQESWSYWVAKAEMLLYRRSAEEYSNLRSEFVQSQELPVNLEVAMEQIMVYFVFAYFCGAVYDDYVYALAQEAVVNCYLILELWFAKWLQQDKSISYEDMVDITYRYSRELEHSQDNLIQMEELMDEAVVVELLRSDNL